MKKVIVLPPAIAEVFILPTNMQAYIGDMMPPMREVIAAHPLSTQYEVAGDRVLHAFINFMLVPPKPKKSRSSWERYDRKSQKRKKTVRNLVLKSVAQISA